MSALVYVEGAAGGEAMKKPEGAVADGVGVGEEASMKRWDWKSVDVGWRYGA